ncbi:MAG TPA: dihydrofolate reductase [Bacilli bacterium]
MISIIVAMDRNNVLGKDNKLPWRLPADLAYFRKLTMGHPILMGRKTYESIGKALPGRENVILTRDRQYDAEGCTIIHSLEEALLKYKEDELFVIGGADIIVQSLSIADKLYITYIDHEFEGDVFFPDIDTSLWVETSREQGIQDEKNPYVYYFLVYERRAARS